MTTAGEVKSIERTTMRSGVKRTVPEKILKPIINNVGSKVFTLFMDGHIHKRTIGALMLLTFDTEQHQNYFYVLKIHDSAYFGIHNNINTLLKRHVNHSGNAELYFSTPIDTEDNIRIVQKIDDVLAISNKPIDKKRYNVDPEIIVKIFNIIMSVYKLRNIC